MYKKVLRAIDPEWAKFIGTTLLLGNHLNRFKEDGSQVIGAPIVYSHEMLEALLVKLQPMIEKESGKSLVPTYSFARIYRNGDELERHTDRPSCEISATLCLAYDSDYLWPIYAGDSGPIELDHGDLMIYTGCDTEHWRNAFTGKLWVQVFLHYVDVEGPYKSHAYDGRDLKKVYEDVAAFLR